MAKPIVVFHGWSDKADSFEPLAQFLQEQLQRPVEVINLADWVSMDDQVSYRDLNVALHAEWKRRRLPRTPRSVDVVTHSTGALVIRHWLTQRFRPKTAPIDHLLMLAPANFGSPLAHKGRALYGRIIKGWRTGFQTGTKILKGLELASPFTWDLAQKDIFTKQAWFGQEGVLATVLVGNTGYAGVRAAANEDGCDGTVRVSTANINATQISIDFSRNPSVPSFTFKPLGEGHAAAFAILDKDTHGSITMKHKKSPHDKNARDLFVRALTVPRIQWDQWCQELNAMTKNVSQKGVKRKGAVYHNYHNLVVRVTDDLKQPVKDYFIEFYEQDSDSSQLATFFHKNVIKTVHAYAEDTSYRSFLIDTTLLDKRIDKENESLDISLVAIPEYEEGRTVVGYKTFDKGNDLGAIRLTPAQVKQIFQPHQTSLIDIRIRREISADLVSIRPLL